MTELGMTELQAHLQNPHWFSVAINQFTAQDMNQQLV
jgi:hypothetical protein